MRIKSTSIAMLMVSGWLCASEPALALSETPDQVEQRLSREWQSYASNWQNSSSDYPFSVSATLDRDESRSESHFMLRRVAFTTLREYLASPRNWCRILLLHLNIKACAHFVQEGKDSIDLYLGRKYLQPPVQSTRLEFVFNSLGREQFFQAVLIAEQGPFGTSDYRITFNAIPAGDAVFVELTLSNRVGYAERFADVYLNTLGRFKVGFTRLGKDIFGREKLVKGRVAAAERNVVRYMLALETAFTDIDAEFLSWARRWHEATEMFKKQLHELDEKEYLAIKVREYANQLQLQEAVDRGERESLKARDEKHK